MRAVNNQSAEFSGFEEGNLLWDSIINIIEDCCYGLGEGSEANVSEKYYSAIVEVSDFLGNGSTDQVNKAKYLISELMEFTRHEYLPAMKLHSVYCAENPEAEVLSEIAEKNPGHLRSVISLKSSIVSFGKKVKDVKFNLDHVRVAGHLVYLASKFTTDKEESDELLKKASEMGYPIALQKLVDNALNDVRETKKAPENLEPLLIQACEFGYYTAATALGLAYEKGVFGIQKDIEQAYEAYCEAVKLADNDPQKKVAGGKAGKMALEISNNSKMPKSLVMLAESAKWGNKEAKEILENFNHFAGKDLNLRKFEKITEVLEICKKAEGLGAEYCQKVIGGFIANHKNLENFSLRDLPKVEAKIKSLTDGQETLLSEDRASFFERKISDYLSHPQRNTETNDLPVSLEKNADNPWVYSCKINFSFSSGPKEKVTFHGEGSRLVIKKFCKTSEDFRRDDKNIKWFERIDSITRNLTLEEKNNQLIFNLDLKKYLGVEPNSAVKTTASSAVSSPQQQSPTHSIS